MSKQTKTVYNVFFFNKKGEQIEQTQIDEKNEQLAWDLFKEFGRRRNAGTYLEWEEDEEDVEED